jgi:hypothetical protein
MEMAKFEMTKCFLGQQIIHQSQPVMSWLLLLSFAMLRELGIHSAVIDMLLARNP